MSGLARFGISIDKELSRKFDIYIKANKYTNRSEAIRDLIREGLIRGEWKKNIKVVAAISLVYDHHQRQLVNKLLEIQHNYQEAIISVQHVHLDHHNCMEIIVAKGKAKKIHDLASCLKAAKGVKHTAINSTTTGKKIK